MPAESKTSKRGRMTAVLSALHRAYPDADCALLWSTPLELLVATILSAQTTDTHVNEVTPGLFRKYTCAADFAAAALEELQDDIKSIGLFRNKSKFIKGACQGLVEDHGGGDSFQVYTEHKGYPAQMTVPYAERAWHNYYQNIAAHLIRGVELAVKPEEARRTIAIMETSEKSATACKPLKAPCP